MSHFTVLVVCPEGTDIDNYEERVTALMAAYDEQREVAWRPGEDDDEEGYWHNPDGHWDYWSVGGRWRGYFPIAPGLTDDDLKQLVVSDARFRALSPGMEGFDPSKKEGRADGGPKRCLGLDKLRDQKGCEAVAEWNTYAAAILGTEPHTYWDTLWARVEESNQAAALALGTSREGLLHQCWVRAADELGLPHDDQGWPKGAAKEDYNQWKAREDELWEAERQRWDAACTYTAEDARHDYWDHPRVKAVTRHPEFKGRFPSTPWIDDLDRYTRDEYEQRARATAVPTFAVVLADGTWCAPGQMGWFGMSTDEDGDRQAFAERMNTYLDGLAGDTFLVVLDCHV